MVSLWLTKVIQLNARSMVPIMSNINTSVVEERNGARATIKIARRVNRSGVDHASASPPMTSRPIGPIPPAEINAQEKRRIRATEDAVSLFWVYGGIRDIWH